MDQEYESKLAEVKRKYEETLQQRIDNGEMINFCGFWISKDTYKNMIDACHKLVNK